MKESIKLKDFFLEVEKHLPIDKGLYKEDTHTYYNCPKCKRSYTEEDKFCSVDGEKIVAKETKYLSDEITKVVTTVWDFEKHFD